MDINYFSLFIECDTIYFGIERFSYTIVNFPFCSIHVSPACWIYIFYNIIELGPQITCSRITITETLTHLSKRFIVVIKNWSNITFCFLNYLHPCSRRNYRYNEHCLLRPNYYYTFRSSWYHSCAVRSFVLLFISNFKFHWSFFAYPDAVVCTGDCNWYIMFHWSWYVMFVLVIVIDILCFIDLGMSCLYWWL